MRTFSSHLDSNTFTGDDRIFIDARIMNHDVALRVSVVCDEHERRREAGIRAVLDREVLTTLSQLPTDVPCDPASLDEQSTACLRLCAPHMVSFGQDDTVTRKLVSPIKVLDVVVESGAKLRHAIDRASTFAPYARRSVVITGETSYSTEDLFEASLFGIGVLDYAEDPITLLEPEPFRPGRYTASSWLFEEIAYSAYLAAVPI
jgi:hypothetical protein